MYHRTDSKACGHPFFLRPFSRSSTLKPLVVQALLEAGAHLDAVNRDGKAFQHLLRGQVLHEVNPQTSPFFFTRTPCVKNYFTLWEIALRLNLVGSFYGGGANCRVSKYKIVFSFLGKCNAGNLNPFFFRPSQVVNPLRHTNLQCLAARALKKAARAEYYSGVLSPALKEFVDMH